MFLPCGTVENVQTQNRIGGRHIFSVLSAGSFCSGSNPRLLCLHSQKGLDVRRNVSRCHELRPLTNVSAAVGRSEDWTRTAQVLKCECVCFTLWSCSQLCGLRVGREKKRDVRWWWGGGVRCVDMPGPDSEVPAVHFAYAKWSIWNLPSACNRWPLEQHKYKPIHTRKHTLMRADFYRQHFSLYIITVQINILRERSCV